MRGQTRARLTCAPASASTVQDVPVGVQGVRWGLESRLLREA